MTYDDAVGLLEDLGCDSPRMVLERLGFQKMLDALAYYAERHGQPAYRAREVLGFIVAAENRTAWDAAVAADNSSSEPS